MTPPDPIVNGPEIPTLTATPAAAAIEDPCRSWNYTTGDGDIDIDLCEIIEHHNSSWQAKKASYPDPFYFYEIEQLTFLGILLFVIVVGNLAVLGAIVLARTQRKSRMNFFIMHLAFADMAVGLINVLTDITWKLTVTWYLGNVGCKLVKYFQTVVIYSSNYVLVALSIDRYDAITHPLRFSGSWRRARVLISMAWILAFLFATPALFMFSETTEVHGRTDVTQCWANMEPKEWKIYLSLVFVVLFLIPAFIIAICYTIMVHTIWSQPRLLNLNGESSTSNGNGAVRKSKIRRRKNGHLMEDDDDSRRVSSRGLIPKAKIKSVKMTFVIVFVFIMCSSPYFVFSLLQVFEFLPRTQTVFAIATFFQSLLPLNSAANPIIYCYFSTNICRNFRKIKLIDWIAERFCPMIGHPNPRVSVLRRKFGNVMNNNHGPLARSRSDFTSMSASVKRSPIVTRQIETTCVFTKEVHFHPRDLQIRHQPQYQTTLLCTNSPHSS